MIGQLGAYSCPTDIMIGQLGAYSSPTDLEVAHFVHFFITLSGELFSRTPAKEVQLRKKPKNYFVFTYKRVV